MAMTAPTYRYQTGTCRLRLSGDRSALSQVSDRPLLRRSHFWLEVWPEGAGTAPGATTPLVTIQGKHHHLMHLRHQVEGYLRMDQPGSLRSRWEVELSRPALSLRRRSIHLSTLQLADLAEVLEQMDRGVGLLSPAILPQRRSPALSVSLGTVAASLVALVVGSQWLTQAPRPLADALVRSPGPGPSNLALPVPKHQPSSPPTPNPAVVPRATANRPPRSAPTGKPAAPPAMDTTPPSPRAARPQPEAPRQDGDSPPRAETLTIAKTPAIAPTASSLPASPWIDSLAQALPTTWRVPEGVDQPLRYHLTLASDGRVEVVEPLGDLAKQYQADLGLPQVGDIPLALTLPPDTRVEMIFWPNGRVEVRSP